MDSLFRAAPCAYMGDGRLCGRTDDRPTVMHPFLGQICAEHTRVKVVPERVTVADMKHHQSFTDQDTLGRGGLS